MTDGTVNFYNDNADDYAANESGPNPRLFPFLQRCKAAGKVLELGTGGGVDAAAINSRQ
jgi:predicted O-methyltransferase YrrM